MTELLQYLKLLLRKQFADHAAGVGDFHRPAAGRGECRIERDVERPADGRHQVFGREGIALDGRAIGAGFADRPATLDRRPAHNGAPRAGEMVAAGVAVDLRRAAKLAH